MSRTIAAPLPVLLILALVVPTGCFNPDEPAAEGETGATGDSGASDASNGTGTETPPPDTDEEPDSTDGPSDSSGTEDAPPELTEFTVNGSTMPAELSTSGVVALDVDAVDDVGIDRVEFFDGGKLVATVTASPYQAEVLMTSTDNGVHEFSAIVFDTAEQIAESEAINLSVNVIGGAIVELRTNLGRPRFNTPRTTIVGDTIDVFSTTPEPGAFIGYYEYDFQLSELHSAELPISLPELITPALSRPFSPSVGEVAVGGFTAQSGDSMLSAFVLDIGTGQLSRIDIAAGSVFIPVLTQDTTGSLIHTVGLGHLEKRPNLAAAASWNTSVGDGALVYDVTTTSDTDVLVGFFQQDCVEASDDCVRKLSPDGSTLWTRGLSVEPLFLRELPNGNIVVAGQHTDTPYDPALRILSSEGDTLYSGDLTSAIGRTGIYGLYVAADSGILVVGRANTSGAVIAEQYAWAVRLSQAGVELWNETYEIGNDSRFTGATTSGDGRMFVVGTRDFDQESFTGDGVLAEIAL